ncbi:MAG: thioredoxin domain-containing protein [candidate division NC10 bacterium]|nr:thioredoxin domain-containing protein [candidate division NC10 bacterium]MDE2321395.1 thioredoxin domain-containing protein [candidate division NC10 bacterium]
MHSIFKRGHRLMGWRVFIVAALLVFVNCAPSAFGDLGITGAWAAETTTRGAEVVAEVDGKPITEEALRAKVRGQLVKLEAQIYDLKLMGLEDMIGVMLLEKAAAAKGLKPDQLLEQEVDSKVPEPTQLEIEAFYQGQKDKLRQPLEEVKEQIIQALKEAKTTDATRAYLHTLRANAKVTLHMQPPRIEVSAAGAPVRGVREAPVTIVEFSDYQCPFCKRSQSVTKQLLQQYSGKVKLAYRDFPIRGLHAQAQKAAEAARCAGDQGKYWEYHDLLFAKAPDLEVASLKQAATALGLDMTRFNECLQQDKYAPLVEQDVQYGVRLGVSSTPTFFINGRPVFGAQPFSVFERVIDEELQKVLAASKGKS